MPTENRSSNTEMVSVQATIESLEEAYAGDSALEFMNDAAQLLRQFKSLSTLEHPGEPVAYLITPPGCSPALVFARDIGQPSKYAEPLYTHADSGEVEQLSQVIRDLNDERDEIGAEVGRLRAQLAERDALLADIKTKLNGQCWAWPGLIRRIDELSASAEPSAPVEIDERAEFEAWYADWFNDLYKPTKPITAESMKASRKGNDYGAGSLGKNGKWAGWQARAALDRKPS